MAGINATTSVRFLSGVGEKRAQTLANMGIFTVRDLLYHFPRAYQHRGDVKLLGEVEKSEVGSFILTVSTQPHTAMVKGRMTLTKFVAVDESGKCNITFFNQGYVSKLFSVGSDFRFWGKVERKGNSFFMTSPSYEACVEGKPLPEFFPIYPLSGTLTQKYMAKIIAAALEVIKNEPMADVLPAELCEERLLPSSEFALNAIHNPASYEMLELARRRFVWEELYTFALAISLSKQKKVEGGAGAPVFKKTDMERFYAAFPFAPTNAQRRVIAEAEADMCDPRGIPMSRLICGDVGSGKTLCAAAAMYMAVANGYQCALMAPTEILATQHYNDIGEIFAKLGIRCELLCGSTPAAKKRIIKSSLKNGDVQCVVGTHALLTKDVEFKNAGIIVTDEQHRFGVMQRAALGDKGKGAHILVMSATPIPRTLALIMYGDLSLSYIDEMPPGRKKVSTFTVDESYRERMNGFIEKQALEGRQTYIVCPAIEAEEDEGLVGLDYEPQKEPQKLKNATEYANELQRLMPRVRVSLMHGKMKPAEKDAVMQSFAKGEIDVLVSTTVIEVGVNVPNATLMIVENADRFGLSQLHQLRGRVGRGQYKSWCILVSDAKSPSAAARLETMTQTNDGLEIAKRDLELRGPGDFMPDKNGTARQHGGFEFKLASFCDDTAQLEAAFDYAMQTLADDPKLEKAENLPAKLLVNNYFGIISNAVN